MSSNTTGTNTPNGSKDAFAQETMEELRATLEELYSQLPPKVDYSQEHHDDDDEDLQTLKSELRNQQAGTNEGGKLSNRTYQSFKEASYPLPNDKRERDRLDYQHMQFMASLHGKLYLSQLGPDVKTVLDIGTGTGSWAIDFAKQHPNMQVLGTDISAIQPAYIPDNCSFILADAEKNWTITKPGSGFDFIHGRALISCFASPQFVFKQAFNALAPGGFIELHDAVFPFQYAGPPPTKSALYNLVNQTIIGAEKTGRPWTNTTNYAKWLKEIGFVDVREKKFYLPLGPWAKGEYYKKLGKMFRRNFLMGMEATRSVILGKGGAELSDGQIKGLVEGTRKEVMRGKVKAYLVTSLQGTAHWKMVNHACQAQNIEADPDIGGPGVMAYFLIISWLAVLFAAFPAYYDFLQWWPKFHRTFQTWPQQPAEDASPNNSAASISTKSDIDREELRPHIAKNFKKLLVSMCDLQAITGITIIIAGFSQIRTISYYHEELVISYWWLTLNSFWTARVDYMNENAKGDPVRLGVRRATTLVSCILGVSFQGYINIRENTGPWDNVNGPCYRWSDNSSSWPWVAGTSLYCFALILLLVPKNKNGERFGIMWYFNQTQKGQDKTIDWFRSSCAQHLEHSTNPEPTSRWKRLLSWSTAKSIFLVLLSGFCCCLYWATMQLLAVISYGEGFYPFFLVVYFCFNIWNTYHIVSLKVLNRNLIVGDETKMGFGQVLAVIIMGNIMFNAVDVFCYKTSLQREYKMYLGREAGMLELENRRGSDGA
ncbi:hypothetical protein G7Y89_g3016 [Cudoniella acicularis]|uniref:Methyltransferase domain-containing protein n=1 Tax=Cudoniella acicularis TaxID=354080 RepID=A0A8H4RS74_9HELO|nr:hypothetical protein G7Y89_g3016 [Cudoniella acicularis]